MNGSTEKRVLVTGGAGYIGSHTCKALARHGFVPVTFDNLSLGHRWAAKWGPLEVGELLDASAVQTVLERYRIASVIHFAASAYVGDSIKDPAAYYRNNFLTTLALLDAMRNTGSTNLIFSSSCSVYGDPVGGPIDEGHPTKPLSPYGQTKLDSEHAIRWYGQAYGIKWLSLRYFNAAGADPEGETGEDHDPETRLVPRAILSALGAAPPLEIFGQDYPTRDGTAVRDYVHVSDLAAAHVKGLFSLISDGASGAFNLGTGSGFSVREVLAAVEQVAGRSVPHRFVERRKGDPTEVVADSRRAQSILGWRPEHSDLFTIVKTAWDWQQGGIYVARKTSLDKTADKASGSERTLGCTHP